MLRYFTPRTASAISLGICVLSVLFCIIAMSVTYWVKLTVDGHDNYTGLFLKTVDNANHDVANNCSSSMSDRACTYLKSAKASAIIGVMLGGLCCMYSYSQMAYEYRSVSPLSFFITGMMAATQFVFLLTCLMTYSNFNNLALDVDDDINVEYPPSQDSGYYWAWDLMITSVVFSFLCSSFNFVYACRCGSQTKRSASNEGLFGFERSV
jgi:hypothetical protein